MSDSKIAAAVGGGGLVALATVQLWLWPGAIGTDIPSWIVLVAVALVYLELRRWVRLADAKRNEDR